MLQDVFVQACKNNGILFVDMTEPLERLYKEEHILAHGFINTAVGSGHLNKYGHNLIARVLTYVIQNNKENNYVPK